MLFEDALCSYFKGVGPYAGLGCDALDKSYRWPKKKWPTPPDGVSADVLRQPTSFQQNVALKFELNRLWHAGPGRRSALQEWVISKWGGIRKNKPTTYIEYGKRLESSEPPTPFKGIASFSKILSIVDPNNFAIYDTHVAVSLNAVQVISAVDNPVAFHYPTGRSNITGDMQNKRGFAMLNRYSVRNLTSHPNNWKKIKRDDVYREYLGALKSASRKLGGTQLHQLEMALFCQAEVLAANAAILDNRKMASILLGRPAKN
jgi:hypothetical protein